MMMSENNVMQYFEDYGYSHSLFNIQCFSDSTNMNTQAGYLELAEYGHAKDYKALPQVNVSIGYHQTDHVPLFYEIYPGSMIDNTECEMMVERAYKYGCKDIGIILDRGYFSQNNIKYIERKGYDYVLMTNGNAKFIQEAIKEVGAKLKMDIVDILMPMNDMEQRQKYHYFMMKRNNMYMCFIMD